MKLLWTFGCAGVGAMVWVNVQFANIRSEVPSKELFDARMSNVVEGLKEVKESLSGSVVKIPRIEADIAALQFEMASMRSWASQLMENHVKYPYEDAARAHDLLDLQDQVDRYHRGD